MKQDHVHAITLYREAAEQGCAPAQFRLGVMYEEGRGCQQDHVQAHTWISLAEARASVAEQPGFALARRNVEKLMKPKQLAEARKRAKSWTETFEQE